MILYRMAGWIDKVWSFLKANVTSARVRVVRDLSVLVAAVATLVVLGTVLDLQRGSAQRGKENQVILRNTGDVVAAIESQTSPEAMQRQQTLVNGIIAIVDCNNQVAIQRFVDILVERGALQSGDVRAITEACTTQRAEG
jgi:hypothetical protein